VVVIVALTVTNCTHSIRKHEEHSSKRKKRKDSPFLCLAISASRNNWTTEKPTLLLLLLSLSLVPQLASFKSEHTCQHQEAVIHIPHTKKDSFKKKTFKQRNRKLRYQTRLLLPQKKLRSVMN